MKAFLIISALLLVILFISCNERKTNRQIFEENLDKNIESCAVAFMQIHLSTDTLSIRAFCRCTMEKMYTIDSTFFTKNITEEMNEIVNEYSVDLFKDCDHLVKHILLQKDSIK